MEYTKVIGGGETDLVTFTTNKLKPGEGYTFFCSLPGYSAIVKPVMADQKDPRGWTIQ